jgi:Tol biopolymer transport system component
MNIRTKERRDYPIVGKVAYVRLSPNGSKIAFVKAEGSECLGNFPIYILDLESGVEERLDIGGFDLAWSPDGSKLVFTQFSPELQYRRRLVIYDLSSHQIIATYYIEDLIWVVGESATPHWVNLKDSNSP